MFFGKFEFIAPEFLMIELEKHKDEILGRSRLSAEEFDKVLKFVIKQLTFIPKSQFSDCLQDAEKVLVGHLKDLQYLALALKYNSKRIFSGDRVLRDLLLERLPSVKVLYPKEMLEMI